MIERERLRTISRPRSISDKRWKHKYMAHLLRGDQYMRASALAFGVPLEEPNVEQHGIQYPTSLMVYRYGAPLGVLVAESDDDVPDAPSEPTVYKWNWRQGKRARDESHQYGVSLGNNKIAADCNSFLFKYRCIPLWRV